MTRRIWISRVLAIIAVLALIATACGSSTVAEPLTDESTEQAATEPEPSTTEAEPTSPVETDEGEETTEADEAEAVDEEQSATETDSTEPVDDDEVEEGEEAEVVGGDPVVLLDQGAEPRTELRLRLTNGTEQLETTQTQVISQTIDGEPVIAGLEQVIDSVTTVTVRTEDELFTIESVIASMNASGETDSAEAAALQAQLEATIGLTSSVVVDDRGLVQANTVENSDVGTPALDDVVSAVSGLANPLPNDPVGVGAVWESTQVLNLLGIAVEQTTTTTLTAINGTRISLDTTIIQNVPPGTVGDIQGQSIRVQSWESGTTTRSTIDLTSATPVIATTSGLTQQVLETAGSVLDQMVEVDTVIRG